MDTNREEPISFGYWVKRRRKSLDFTQEHLASLVGCSPVTIKKIEADERRPSRQLAELLAEHLGISTEQREQFIGSARGEKSIPDTLFTQTPDNLLKELLESNELPAYLQTKGRVKPQKQFSFVARSNEIEFLQRHMSEVINGFGRVVFVSGEAGSGKTTLLTEFASCAQEEHSELVVVWGNCTAYSGSGDPYLPFRDALSMLTGDIESKLTSGSISTDGARRLWQLFPNALQGLVEKGPNLINAFIPAASLIQSAKLRNPGATKWGQSLDQLFKRIRRQTGKAEQVQLLEQYTQVIQHIASKRPLLILLDDLQWADRASISLLFHLGRRLTGSAVMILGAFRPSDVAVGYGSLSDAEHKQHPLEVVLNEFKLQYGEILLGLETSNPENGRRFVGAYLDTEPNDLDDNFRKNLFGRTKGHPLFTIEFIRVLQERGDIVRDDQGKWIESSTLNWDALPLRVEAVLEQRLGRLDKTLREILAVASVEGEIFTAQVLAQVQNVEERSILQLLSQSIERRHRLIQERDEFRVRGEQLFRFQFSHILFQQYLYDHLGLGEKRLLHARVGSILEKIYGDKCDEIAVQLAHHFHKAGEQEKAFDYALRASVRAENVFAFAEAIEYLELALSTLITTEEPEKTLMVLEHLADDLAALGDRAQAIQHLQNAIEIWKNMSVSEKMTGVRLYRKLGEMVVNMTWFSDRQKFEALSESSLEAGLSLSREEPPHPEIVRLFTTLSYDAWLPRATPDWQRAEQYAQQAVNMAEDLDSPVDLSAALDALGKVYGGLDRYEERVEIAQRRLDLSQSPEFTDVRQRVSVLHQVGQAYILIGQYHEALPYLTEAEEISSQIQSIDQQYRALRHQATSWYFLDQWETVVEINKKVRDLEVRYPNFLERVGPTCFQKAITASALALLGRSVEAKQLREESLGFMIANDGPREGWGRDNLF